MTTPATLPTYPRVLSIAGSDSGGGAGIQADLKTFSALGCFGMTAITAITAQNTVAVTAIHGVPADVLKAQIEAVLDDIGVDAVKIGMLHAPELVDIVAWAIKYYGIQKVVLDPVMVSASGDPLINEETVSELVRQLFPLVSVITPNLDEAARLLNHPITSLQGIEAAANELLGMGAKAALVKGAHLAGDELIDVLAQHGAEPLRLQSQRVATPNIHGSDCTLSSAIAAYLALGQALPDAVRSAHQYVFGAIQAGAKVTTGKGHGPLNHSYAPVAMHVGA